MIVDSDACELPAGPGSPAARIALAAAIAGDAMADGIETTEFLDVDMDDLAGLLALIAWPWLLRLERREQTEAAPPENARDTGFGDDELAGDMLLGVAPAAQSLDDIGCGGGDSAWR